MNVCTVIHSSCSYCVLLQALTSQQTGYNMRMIAAYCCTSNSRLRTGTEHTPVKTGRFCKSISQQDQIAANELMFQKDVFLRNLNKQTIAFESQSDSNVTQPRFGVQLTETPRLVPECFARPTITSLDLSKMALIHCGPQTLSKAIICTKFRA